uniref:Olfactory receptor C family, n1 n=1 Tax=Oryzias sinensis TaxID=183150 RepID=A0A8C7YM97_9TELE
MSRVSGCDTFAHFNMPSLSKPGDIMIGGIFPIFNKEISNTVMFEREPLGTVCSGFDLRAFRWTQVMIFAIEEINKDPAFLPNVSLGYRILDSCASPTNALRTALTLAGGLQGMGSPCPPAISALIAESGSSQSVVVAGALGPFQLPIISYFSTCACLSNRAKFPTFFRTIPSDYFQAKALAALVKHFGWKWIGAIQSDNDYGRNGMQAFTEEVQKIGVCVAFVGTVLRTYSMSKILDVVEMIKQSSVKVILAFVPEGDFYPLMKEVLRQNITGIQWIASEAWITAARPSTPEMFPAFGGTLGFVVKINPYTDPNAAFVKDFWEAMFGCRPVSTGIYRDSSEINKICQGNETLMDSQDVFFNVTELRVSYNVYKAVYAIAHALHELVFCQSVDRKSARPCMNVSEIHPKEVTEYVKRVNFSNRFGDNVFFDEDGDPPASYDIINWQLDNGKVQHVTVGQFISTQSGNYKLQIDEEKIIWMTGKMVTIKKMIFCTTFKASNSELSCFLLFSLFLCFICPLTFIGRPTLWTCMLRHTAFGITFALCISCVLGKTTVVVTAFKARHPGNKAARKFGPVQQRIIVCSCTMIQVVICIFWLSLSPPFPEKVFRYSNKKIILECNTGSEAAFYLVLGYIGVLAAICLVFAFLARKLPDNFNEAKCITFSMLIFCAVWITFIPAYVSSPGKFTVAVEIFAILSSTFGLLICIFAPKCYIILIKPEKNTKSRILGPILDKYGHRKNSADFR